MRVLLVAIDDFKTWQSLHYVAESYGAAWRDRFAVLPGQHTLKFTWFLYSSTNWLGDPAGGVGKGEFNVLLSAKAGHKYTIVLHGWPVGPGNTALQIAENEAPQIEIQSEPTD